MRSHAHAQSQAHSFTPVAAYMFAYSHANIIAFTIATHMNMSTHVFDSHSHIRTAIHACACRHTYILACTHVRTCTCMGAIGYGCACVRHCLHASAPIHTCSVGCMSAPTHTVAREYTCARTHTCICTHACINHFAHARTRMHTNHIPCMHTCSRT